MLNGEKKGKMMYVVVNSAEGYPEEEEESCQSLYDRFEAKEEEKQERKTDDSRKLTQGKDKGKKDKKEIEYSIVYRFRQVV